MLNLDNLLVTAMKDTVSISIAKLVTVEVARIVMNVNRCVIGLAEVGWNQKMKMTKLRNF